MSNLFRNFMARAESVAAGFNQRNDIKSRGTLTGLYTYFIAAVHFHLPYNARSSFCPIPFLQTNATSSLVVEISKIRYL